MIRNKNPLNQLLDIMHRLRDPDTGCAWDVKQNFRSIAPFTIEEAYEVADAIERNDLDDLQDELGDLLFQVVFHAQMASEQSAFTFDDVAQSIVDKMIRRHPHVFGDVVYQSEQDLKRAWEAIKAQERAHRLDRRSQQRVLDDAVDEGRQSQGSKASREADSRANAIAHSALDGIAVNLPALKRADKIQKRAARVGFDWPTIDPVWEKLNEEIDEVKEAIVSGDSDAIEDELGDLLFTVVNIARHCSIDSELALTRASAKFSHRFKQVEMQAASEGLTLSTTDLAQLNELWERAKG